MKPHELMLKGYAMVGRQCRDGNFAHGDSWEPDAVCAIGALQLACTGSARVYCLQSEDAHRTFKKATGTSITLANDEGMSIEDIAGILKAEGA